MSDNATKEYARLMDQWRERAERAEARVAELQAGQDASDRAAVKMIDRYEAVEADRDAGITFVAHLVLNGYVPGCPTCGKAVEWAALNDPATPCGAAFLARVDSGTEPTDPPCPVCGFPDPSRGGHTMNADLTAERKCEVPGCDNPARIRRVQRSGDVVWVCGEIHVYPRESP